MNGLFAVDHQCPSLESLIHLAFFSEVILHISDRCYSSSENPTLLSQTYSLHLFVFLPFFLPDITYLASFFPESFHIDLKYPLHCYEWSNRLENKLILQLMPFLPCDIVDTWVKMQNYLATRQKRTNRTIPKIKNKATEGPVSIFLQMTNSFVILYKFYLNLIR